MPNTFFFAHLNSYRVTFEMQAETRLHSKTVPGIVATADLSYRSEGINFIEISSSSLRSLNAGNRRDKKSRRLWCAVPNVLCKRAETFVLLKRNKCYRYIIEMYVEASKFSGIILFLRMKSSIFKLHFHQTSPTVQIYTSVRDCKVAGNIPGSHFVKDFSALLSHP